MKCDFLQEDREKKRLEENQRKQENRKLAEEEDAALASSATTVPAKMTRYQLQVHHFLAIILELHIVYLCVVI